jgi:aspartate aminotransferase-like enzyme
VDKKRDLSSVLVPETKAIAESYAALHTQFATGLSALIAAQKTDRAVLTALLHKSGAERISPFPGRTYPTATVTGMPSAV